MRFRDLRELIRLSYGEESRPGNWTSGIGPDFLEDLRSRNFKRQAELWMEQAQALNWHTLLRWFDRCYNFCGLEEVCGPELFGYQDRLTYCNTGESYGLTLGWDHDKRELVITTWADWLEAHEAEWLEESWQDSLCSEFEQELERRLQLWTIEGEQEQFWQLFQQLCRRNSSYAYMGGQSSSPAFQVDWDAVLKGVSHADLDEAKIQYEKEED